MNYIKIIAFCTGFFILAGCSRVNDGFVILKQEPISEYMVPPKFMANPPSAKPLPFDKLVAAGLSKAQQLGGTTASDTVELPFVRPSPSNSNSALPSPSANINLTTLQADIAVEVDYEMHLKLGNDIEKSKHYVKELFRALNVIYKRDSNVILNPSFVRIWTTSADPWTQTYSYDALTELRNYWNLNHKTTPRAVVLLLSGKYLGGGVAYRGSACLQNDTANNTGYDTAVAGDLNGYFDEFSSFNTWDLVVVAHELGHSFNSKHSHCTISTVTGNYLDRCYVEGPSSCYAGPVVPTQGSMMSYCDQNSPGMPNINPLSFSTYTGDSTISNIIRTYAQDYSTITNSKGCFKPYVAPVPSPYSWLPSVIQFLLD